MANVVSTIRGLIELFKPHCANYGTLNELAEFTADHTQWRRAHDLFDRIRKKRKRLPAERTSGPCRESQYLFEEACA